MSEPVPITPETRVAQLLEAYPDLQEVLIAAAPAFSKLKNPVLRRTIARVTSLKRAAEVAGISTKDLVIQLRRAAGLGPVEADLADDPESGLQDGPALWVDPGRVQWTVDADSLLATDQQPISEVMQKASDLSGDELGLIRSSFRPAPLIEMLETQGFRTAVVCSDDSFATFVGLTPE
jgi:hypothetical protein